MSFFKKLFGGRDEKPNADNGDMPTRALNLQFAPTPDNAEKLAQLFVGAVLKNEKKELDYSVDTLNFVDWFLIHNTATSLKRQHCASPFQTAHRWTKLLIFTLSKSEDNGRTCYKY